jgi:hypothetical protein
MIQTLVNFTKQMDLAINGAETLVSKLMVIFFIWLGVSIPLYLIGIAGSYVGGSLIALSIVANIVWCVLCGILVGTNISREMETTRKNSKW